MDFEHSISKTDEKRESDLNWEACHTVYTIEYAWKDHRIIEVTLEILGLKDWGYQRNVVKRDRERKRIRSTSKYLGNIKEMYCERLIACPSAFYLFRKFGYVPELSDSFWILRGLSQIFSDTSWKYKIFALVFFCKNLAMFNSMV